jgi:formyltetrahydrofolate deformylase
MDSTNRNTAILLVYCPDQRGIVAKVTEFIDNNNGNVVYLDQHVDFEENMFFMRLEWELEKFLIPAPKIADYFQTQIASKYKMQFELYFSANKPRMAIFVTKLSHCLYDMLARYQSGEWDAEIPLIISNHEMLKPVAERFNIPFHIFNVTQENKAEQEKKQIELLKKNGIDFIILARYMQILSPTLINEFPHRIINIHHSFLPAFPGAKPYHSAYKRGVKIIGATSHYVTADLDEGPIIDQDVTRVSHKDPLDTLIRKGQDLEKIVLSRAVYLHLHHRVLTYNNKTIVFN